MRPTRVLLLLVLGLTTGCARCAGIEEEKKPQESPQEIRAQGRQRFRLNALAREGGIGREGGVDPSAPQGSAQP